MESITYLKNLKVSPKKIRFYLKAVKKLTPAESLKFLFYGRQTATRILYKAIESAVANATKILKIDAGLLNFKLLTIEEGTVLKRFKPGARGNVRPILKRTSHIKIVLVAKIPVKPEEKVKQKEEKSTAENPKSQSTNDKSMTKSKLQIKKDKE